MGPLKLISDYIDRARSQIYGIFVFWVLLFHLPVFFTAIFVDQELLYRKTGMLKNEYIKSVFFDFSDKTHVVSEISWLLLAALLTYLMIWVLPRTLIASAYKRELEDQYDREFKKLTKDGELETKKQALADKQLVTAEKIETAVKKQDDVEQLEKDQWKDELSKFAASKLINVMPVVADSVYKFKGHINPYYDGDLEEWVNPSIKSEDVAIAHSNGLIDLNTENSTIALTEKGKHFLSQSYYDRLP